MKTLDDLWAAWDRIINHCDARDPVTGHPILYCKGLNGILQQMNDECYAEFDRAKAEELVAARRASRKEALNRGRKRAMTSVTTNTKEG